MSLYYFHNPKKEVRAIIEAKCSSGMIKFCKSKGEHKEDHCFITIKDPDIIMKEIITANHPKKKGQTINYPLPIFIKDKTKNDFEKMGKYFDFNKTVIEGKDNIKFEKKSRNFKLGAEIRTQPFKLTPNNIIKAFEKLLSEKGKSLENNQNNSVLFQKFRLELRKIEYQFEEAWIAVLRICSTVWYDYIGKKLDKRIARNYSNQLRDLDKNIKYYLSDVLPDPIPHSCPASDIELCTTYPQCLKKNLQHSEIYCPEKSVKRLDGSLYHCQWKIADELVIFRDSLNQFPFVLSARREGTRDLLLCPEIHATNYDLIFKQGMNSAFWTIAVNFVNYIQSVDKDGIELVAINFGKWETEHALDQFAVSCHGHVHFLISPNIVDELTKKGLSAVKGRYYKPEVYFESEANALDPRILSEEINEIKKSQIKVEKDVSEIKKRQKKMEKDVSELKQSQITLEKDVSEMKLKQTKMEKDISKILGIMEHVYGRSLNK